MKSTFFAAAAFLVASVSAFPSKNVKNTKPSCEFRQRFLTPRLY